MALRRRLALALFLALALRPQGVLERSRIVLPEDERRAIEDARQGARPRPFAQRRAPLGAAERERVRAFEAARASVVQVSVAGPSAQRFGSGVVWDDLGHIVTNYHLVADLDQPAAPFVLPLGERFPPLGPAPPSAERTEMAHIIVRAPDGAECAARLMGAAPELDLALLKTDAPMKGAVPIRLGRSADLAVGQAALALGNPFGYDHSLTGGIVSALGRVIASPAGTPMGGIIQTDAAMNRGGSGGPLLDSNGRMIGLCAASTSPSGWNAGLNYAIPSETIAGEMARLLGTARGAEPSPPLTPKDLASVGAFGRVRDSVVGVRARELYRNPWTGFESLNPVGSGSGVVWGADGHIVTSFHVIAQKAQHTGGLKAADAITVTTRDGQELPAVVAAMRPDIDIAVLKIDRLPEGLAPIPIGSSAKLAVGQPVLALGSPFGNGHSLTSGIVSALDRTIESPVGSPIMGVLQTDAAINPGNSGGPLLDIEGRMLGINAMMASSTGTNAGVGFAVPVDLVRREMEGIAAPAAPASAAPGGIDGLGGQNAAAVLKRAKGAVAFVHAEAQAGKHDPSGGPSGGPSDGWTGDIFRLPPTSGTGIVWDDRGHIVTAYRTVLAHDPLSGQVLEADRLTVTLSDGSTYRARIIGRSLEYQVAVLRVFAPFKDLRPLPLAAPSSLKVGQDIFALGNPFGMDISLSAGVLSAKRDLNAKLRGVIQTDAAINPGNIGGPILDSEGRLVGMGLLVEGPGAHSGINFALSSGTLNRIVPLLLAKGQVERPVLGFVSVAGPDARRRFGVGKGVLVQSVDKGSPASRAGLMGLRSSKVHGGPEVGDVIMGLGGKRVDDSDALWDLIEQEPPGAPLPLDVLRDGRRIRVVLRPGDGGYGG
jgi:S1-C subfamily serine protease